MTDCGRSTSDRSGWVGCTKRRGGSWIISAAPLAERVGITREGVTNQLITKCHLSSELFKTSEVSLNLLGRHYSRGEDFHVIEGVFRAFDAFQLANCRQQFSFAGNYHIPDVARREG